MASVALRTCVRCHHKKIRCSGHPECQNCTGAGAECEPYRRRQKRNASLETLIYFRERTEWLEEQLRRHFGVSAKDVETGTSLKPGLSIREVPQQLTPVEDDTPSSSKSLRQENQTAVADDTLETSLLALNATGEMRYLGPSSGIFFASYAGALARSCLGEHEQSNIRNATPGLRDITPIMNNELLVLSCDESRILLQSFRMWIEPLYPIIDLLALEELTARCLTNQSISGVDRTQDSRPNIEVVVFYLVMALGAINYRNTAKQLQTESHPKYQDCSSSKQLSALLYHKAMDYMDINAKHLVPSIPFIQVLLLVAIYSSYGPIASSQWQVAGMAMRMAVELGLHNSSRGHGLSEPAEEQRKGVFWTAYTVELSLAYNLGRPPSIGEEHITTELPKISDTTLFSSLHIRHRYIQSRIVRQVYSINNKSEITIDTQRTIARLQGELDEWKTSIPDVSQSDHTMAYPYLFWLRLYHGTSFVLHRSSPLCSNPSRESVEKCLQSAGAYIDNILEVMRGSNVPLSWMLVQGLIFAGLTMLITARTSFKKLDQRTGLVSLLVDLPAWTRKCSVCLAIMNERWNEDILLRLNSQFEVLVNDTLRIISAAVTSTRETVTFEDMPIPWPSETTIPSPAMHDCTFQDAPLPDSDFAGGWDDFELMRDIMGFDPGQTFWDTIPLS